MRLLALAAVAATSLATTMPSSADAAKLVIVKGALPIEAFGIFSDVDKQLARLIDAGARFEDMLNLTIQLINERQPPRNVFSDSDTKAVSVDNVFTTFVGSGYITIENHSDGSYFTRIATEAEIRFYNSERGDGPQVSAIPDAPTWMMLLTGFSLVAGVARYRRRKITTTYA